MQRHIGLDFEACVDEDGSTTFLLIVTFVNANNIRNEHRIFLSKVLRLNQRKRKLRKIADAKKDMTQATVSLSQKEATEMMKKILLMMTDY